MDNSKKAKLYLTSILLLNVVCLSIPILVIHQMKITENSLQSFFIVWAVLNLSALMGGFSFSKPVDVKVKIGSAISLVMLVFQLWGVLGFRVL